MNKFIFHGVIEKDTERYKAICLELDIATEGRDLEEARQNLKEAVEGYVECAVLENDVDIFVPRPVPEDIIRKYERLFKDYSVVRDTSFFLNTNLINRLNPITKRLPTFTICTQSQQQFCVT